MVATRKLIQELIKRKLCIQCCDINDKFPKRRCSRCHRLNYVRERIKTIEAHLDYYIQELKNLQEEREMIKKAKKYG